MLHYLQANQHTSIALFFALFQMDRKFRFTKPALGCLKRQYKFLNARQLSGLDVVILMGVQQATRNFMNNEKNFGN